jgi:hypothetical protein
VPGARQLLGGAVAENLRPLLIGQRLPPLNFRLLLAALVLDVPKLSR